MSIPTLGGLAVFGRSVTMSTAEEPRARQHTAFFGLDGVEALDGGARGWKTTVKGVMTGSGDGGAAAALATLRTFQDGRPRILIDPSGSVWPSVIVDTVSPTGRVRRTPTGQTLQPYTAVLTHLENP